MIKTKICSVCGREHHDDYKDVCYTCYQRALMTKNRYSEKSSIYTITNKKTGKVYVGSTKNVATYRLRSHINSSFNVNCKDFNLELRQDIREEGIEAFDIKVIEECSHSEQKIKEQMTIEAYMKAGVQLYNTRNAVSLKKIELTEEEKIKMRDEMLARLGLAI